jgi:hypothetical protein
LGQKKNRKKLIILGREDVFLVHPQNSFNGLILNWCIGGCWFTPAQKVDCDTTLVNARSGVG